MEFKRNIKIRKKKSAIFTQIVLNGLNNSFANFSIVIFCFKCDVFYYIF